MAPRLPRPSRPRGRTRLRLAAPLAALAVLAPLPGGAARAERGPVARLEPRGAVEVPAGGEGGAEAEPSRPRAAGLVLPRIEFDAVTEDGQELLALGVNAFTAAQIGRFVAGVPAFLAASSELAPGERLVLRQEGVRGYISLSTVLEPGDGPRFLITLRAEPPGEIAEEDALRALIALVGDQALTQAPRQVR